MILGNRFLSLPSGFGNPIMKDHLMPRLYALSIFVLSATAAFAQAEASPSPKVKLYMPYKEYSQEDNQKILAMYEDLRVADVSDGMDVVGLANVGIMNAEIKALWRDTENFTHRIIGVAVTARYVPTNRREIQMDKATIDKWYKERTQETFQKMLFPGSILVIDAAEDGESRSIGSNNIMQWHKKGMLGVVTSGGLGDSDEIIAEKVPAYYRRLERGIRPGRNELESVNRPVMCGGVLVRPGDIVIADGDGVVVVPREQAAEVAQASRQFLDQIGLERAQQKALQRKK
jgi:4-hydroxy-4-methyl-2-oxoglutarate aldolase